MNHNPDDSNMMDGNSPSRLIQTNLDENVMQPNK